MRQLQKVQCDGHTLELSISKRSSSVTSRSQSERKSSSEQSAKASSVKPTSKILVRNVPFEATKRELRELFGTFGQLKSVRLPRKFDNTHRGFAFVEFLTKQEAKQAYDALVHTHFYGRHMVLE